MSTDTTSATEDSSDPDVDWCWYRLSHTVFYSYETSDATLLKYSSNVAGAAAVYAVGDAGELSFIGASCDDGENDPTNEVRLSSASKYLVMVGSAPVCRYDDSDYSYDCVRGSGGTGTLTLRQAPPALDVEVAVTRTTVNQRTGVARVAGEVTCNTPGWYHGWGQLRQRTSRTTATLTGFYVSGHCDESGRSAWTASWDSAASVYNVGAAHLRLDLYGSDNYTGDSDRIDAMVRLSASRD